MILEIALALTLVQDLKSLPKTPASSADKSEKIEWVNLPKEVVQDLTIQDLQAKILEKEFKVLQLEIETRQAVMSAIRQTYAEAVVKRKEYFSKELIKRGVPESEIEEFETTEINKESGMMVLKRKKAK